MGLGLVDLFQGASTTFSSIDQIPPDLTNKTIIITGSNSGIGLATTKALAKKNATVFMLCRSPSRTQPLIDKLRIETGNSKIEFVYCDLADWDSIVAAARFIRGKTGCVDVLVNNAGILGVREFSRCRQGMELQMSSNYFGHYILTRELMPLISAAVEGRVVNVTSNVHASAVGAGGYYAKQAFNYGCVEKEGYHAYQNYCQSKLANVLFTVQLQKNLVKRGITNVSVIAVHPGVIDSNILSAAGMNWLNPLIRMIRSDVETGAMTQVYAATHAGVVERGLRGVYLVPVGKVGVMSSVAGDEERVEEFWEWTERMLGECKFGAEWVYQ